MNLTCQDCGSPWFIDHTGKGVQQPQAALDLRLADGSPAAKQGDCFECQQDTPTARAGGGDDSSSCSSTRGVAL